MSPGVGEGSVLQAVQAVVPVVRSALSCTTSDVPSVSGPSLANLMMERPYPGESYTHLTPHLTPHPTPPLTKHSLTRLDLGIHTRAHAHTHTHTCSLSAASFKASSFSTLSVLLQVSLNFHTSVLSTPHTSHIRRHLKLRNTQLCAAPSRPRPAAAASRCLQCTDQKLWLSASGLVTLWRSFKE
jgi:hypothetical protein